MRRWLHYSFMELVHIEWIRRLELNSAPHASKRAMLGYFCTGLWLLHRRVFPERLFTILTCQRGDANVTGYLPAAEPARELCLPGRSSACVLTSMSKVSTTTFSAPGFKTIHLTAHQLVLLCCGELSLFITCKGSALLRPQRTDLWLQVSPLCHEHGCIRRTHLIIETAYAKMRLNACKLAGACLNCAVRCCLG